MTATSWYRRSVWNYKGNREYTKSGFDAAKLRFGPDDLEVDCSDRHYLITGSNQGIGFEIATELAKRGGVLHMLCRNFESAKKARSQIITNTGNDKIHLHTVDLAKPRDVVAWAGEFAIKQERLHVLINNAGCMVHERHLDDDGIETNFAVNSLAVYIITTTLLPLLQRSPDARVVTVSSAGMLTVRLDTTDLMHEVMEPFNGALVYSQQKRQQVIMMLWFAQRYDRIHFSSMHPGWADTTAVRTSLPQFFEAMKDNLRSASEGADTAVWLAISKAALKHPSGLFFQDREPVSTHLPLAWTKSSIEEEEQFMEKMLELHLKVSGSMRAQTEENPVATSPPRITSQDTAAPPLATKASDPESNSHMIENASEVITAAAPSASDSEKEDQQTAQLLLQTELQETLETSHTNVTEEGHPSTEMTVSEAQNGDEVSCNESAASFNNENSETEDAVINNCEEPIPDSSQLSSQSEPTVVQPSGLMSNSVEEDSPVIQTVTSEEIAELSSESSQENAKSNEVSLTTEEIKCQNSKAEHFANDLASVHFPTRESIAINSHPSAVIDSEVPIPPVSESAATDKSISDKTDELEFTGSSSEPPAEAASEMKNISCTEVNDDDKNNELKDEKYIPNDEISNERSSHKESKDVQLSEPVAPAENSSKIHPEV